MELNKLYCGDSLENLKIFPDNSIDSIVTDPPYGLSFINKHWDYSVPKVELWKECLRVLKPGGHLFSFAGTRTYHKIASGIEDAGFEIRDMISWIYGSGFSKSLNIGKAIDKMQGNEREVIGSKKGQGNIPNDRGNWGLKPNEDVILTKGNSQYEGWGTALKPACEPICVARKPIPTTVAENVLKYGTGGINIDGCRIGDEIRITKGMSKLKPDGAGTFRDDNWQPKDIETISQGRFPANIIFDEQAAIVLDEMSGELKSAGNKRDMNKNHNYNNSSYQISSSKNPNYHPGNGGASRFFYCAKSSKSERNGGLEGFEEKQRDTTRIEGNPGGDNPRNRGVNKISNNHPTVKPLKLMQYLVRLVTPKSGICLDPFAGSGTTLMACVKEGFNYIGIERESEYVKIAEARIEWAKTELEREIRISNSQIKINLFKRGIFV